MTLAPELYAYDSPAALGEALFFDTRLSAGNTQSCATCHAPQFGFVDPRSRTSQLAISPGAKGLASGRRNTPSLSYIGSTPPFQRTEDGGYRGGFFYDGRAATLAEQAHGPIFGSTEMSLGSAAKLRARISQSPRYQAALRQFYGPQTLQADAPLLQAVSKSLASFQSSSAFAPFDARYDRYLRGEVEFTRMEEIGRLLFFSNLINCNSCHHLNQPTRETFTDYTFHNIGIPANPHLGLKTDLGLAENPITPQHKHRGKFKVPSLRNVAVTAPYMHNGVFQELATVLAFYNKYLLQAEANPESGKPWRAPEVDENLSLDLLQQGQPLDDYRIQSLIAFLKTLTDQRYVHLLD